VGSLTQAAREVPRLRGLLVGEGPVMSEVRQLIDATSSSDRVKLTGYRSDARDLVQAMDLFVLSSFSEGTSMALLEAMAAGVAVAVTDVGGNPEVVQREQTGWIVASDDREALTVALLEAVRNPQKRQAFADAGRHRFETQFAMRSMIARYRDEYRRLSKP
jgi:L-malate glycosyltransferase